MNTNQPAKINFFTKVFSTTILFIIFFELLSFFTNWFDIIYNLNSIFWILIVLVVFIVSLWKLEYGVYFALAELFIGSQGHYFDLQTDKITLSIRIGIFLAVMLAWVVYVIRKKAYKKQLEFLKQNKLLIFLAVFCVWGLVFALIRDNSLSNIFLDFNAWLYFLYFFPFLTILTKWKQFNKVLQIFTAAVLAICLKSLLFLFVFSHKMWVMRDLYRWGRDTRWGEFTAVSDSLFRIFSQAQIFVLIGFFIFLTYIFFKKAQNMRFHDIKHESGPLIILLLCSSTIILSLSRSFWVALAAGIVIVFLFAIFKQKLSLKKNLFLLITIIILAALGYGLTLGIMAFPYPHPSDIDASSFAKRLSIDNAISSRWSQLPELKKVIFNHPVVGSGWGTTVTYQSQDPRILTEENPEGWYTTYAFEWGYLDILLKIGLVGLVIYLILIWDIFKKTWSYIKKTDHLTSALLMGSLIALIAVIIVHGFSPYLNHPLGIGILLILLALINIREKITNEQ